MRQKVAICCALLHSPRVILFDEPLTGLDPHAIKTIKETIVGRAREGASVILSSHLLLLVEDLCTHYLILEKGRKRFFGNLAEARAAFDDLRGDASLEEVFFRATESEKEVRSS
jgi:ABC-2 type transport system ATP-binding protein